MKRIEDRSSQQTATTQNKTITYSGGSIPTYRYFRMLIDEGYKSDYVEIAELQFFVA